MLVDDNLETPEETEEREEEERKLEELREARAREERCSLQFTSRDLFSPFLHLLALFTGSWEEGDQQQVDLLVDCSLTLMKHKKGELGRAKGQSSRYTLQVLHRF